MARLGLLPLRAVFVFRYLWENTASPRPLWYNDRVAGNHHIAAPLGRSRLRSVIRTLGVVAPAWLLFSFFAGAHAYDLDLAHLAGIFSSRGVFLAMMCWGSIRLATYCVIGLIAWGLTRKAGLGFAVAVGAALFDISLKSLEVLLRVLAPWSP